MQENSFLANILRNSLLNQMDVQNVSEVKKEEQFEYISKAQKDYISPIMSMNEDEMVAFVEEFDVNELATLSNAELDRLSEVLGKDEEENN